MAQDITIHLTDADEANFALLNITNIPAQIYAAYVQANVARGADHRRKQALEDKLRRLPRGSKNLVAVLERQHAADRAALIEDEFTRIP